MRVFSVLIARFLRMPSITWDRMRSIILTGWLRRCYPGLRIGRGVFVGTGTRIWVANGATLVIGDRTRIEPGCILHSEGHLTIGADGFVGPNSRIVALGRIEIGADALIADNVTIRDQDHRTTSRDVPYRLQGFDVRPVTIGSNVWLGTNAVILKGVSIGDGAVIAAAAVVTKPVPAHMLAAGVPARLVKRRE